MKKIFICLILLITGCGMAKSISPFTEVSTDNNIYINIDSSSIASDSLNYTLYNNTDSDIAYGVDYYIESSENGKWYAYNVEVSWIEIAQITSAHSSSEQTISWENIYGKLNKGQYRLIKKINNEIISAEFEIK